MGRAEKRRAARRVAARARAREDAAQAQEAAQARQSEQLVSVYEMGRGTFTLEANGVLTEAIPYDATEAQVQAAIDRAGL